MGMHPDETLDDLQRERDADSDSHSVTQGLHGEHDYLGGDNNEQQDNEHQIFGYGGALVAANDEMDAADAESVGSEAPLHGAYMYLIIKGINPPSLTVYNPETATWMTQIIPELDNLEIIGYDMSGWVLLQKSRDVLHYNIRTGVIISLPQLPFVPPGLVIRGGFTRDPENPNNRTVVVSLSKSVLWAAFCFRDVWQTLNEKIISSPVLDYWSSLTGFKIIGENVHVLDSHGQLTTIFPTLMISTTALIPTDLIKFDSSLVDHEGDLYAVALGMNMDIVYCARIHVVGAETFAEQIWNEGWSIYTVNMGGGTIFTDQGSSGMFYAGPSFHNVELAHYLSSVNVNMSKLCAPNTNACFCSFGWLRSQQPFF